MRLSVLFRGVVPAVLTLLPVAVHAQALERPPISPGRAFLASALVPGFAQAKLNRSTGLLFVTVEAIGLTMYLKARHDLSLARKVARDSTPLSYLLDPVTGLPQRDEETGDLIVATWSPSRYPPGRISARRTHTEDWVAVLVFNHLFAAIDGYVAAQLWELPTQLELRALPRGLTIRARLSW
jgi:hypothetical protein